MTPHPTTSFSGLRNWSVECPLKVETILCQCSLANATETKGSSSTDLRGARFRCKLYPFGLYYLLLRWLIRSIFWTLLRRLCGGFPTLEPVKYQVSLSKDERGGRHPGHAWSVERGRFAVMFRSEDLPAPTANSAEGDVLSLTTDDAQSELHLSRADGIWRCNLNGL